MIQQIDNVKEYYRRITEIDIVEVAQELLRERITEDLPDRQECDCPNHQSQSHRSLHIVPQKQCWYCFGCGVGGDVLQLVEFVQSGTVTAGKNGTMPDSHRKARDFLADKVGLEPLSIKVMTAKEMKQTEKQRAYELRIKDCLTETARFYNECLKRNKEVLAWLKEKYAIEDDTIDNLLIGYADPDPDIFGYLIDDMDFLSGELAATGAFKPTENGGLYKFFKHRITFPYWSQGRVVFMIGRKTPWTEDKRWEQGKYKKLPIHSEKNRHVAQCIDNSVLYNEDCLLSKPDSVIITEGVTDCLALMQQGYPVISPVTVRIRREDWQRLLLKLRGVRQIYICQDNEISEAGLKGSLDTARQFTNRNIDTRIVMLPLTDKQTTAREELKERFDITTAIGSRELKKVLEGRSESELEEALKLLGDAKIDVNDFFLAGNGKAEFDKLLNQSSSAIDYAIQALPKDTPEKDLTKVLDPILCEVALCNAFEQSRLIDVIIDHFEKRIKKNTVKKQLKELSKSATDKFTRELNNSVPGSCRATVYQVLSSSKYLTGSPDYLAAAEAAFDWFNNSAAQFFKTPDNKTFMYYDNEIFWMDSHESGFKRHFSSMIYNVTGMAPKSYGGKIFIDVLADLAYKKGKFRERLLWLHTDVSNFTVYFNLNNPNHEIARISPDGVEIVKNGGNDDNIILECSNKMKPITFTDDVDLDGVDQIITNLLLMNMTCSKAERILIVSWLSCFLLLDFCGTKPMTRFEGTAGSGKTTASKFISTLLYGEPQQKKSTDAANYSDGARNPLIVLDNIEVKQMTDELISFMLTSITGVAKEKRKSGSDMQTVVEKTKCLINTTGIEPLCGELSEILTRTFVVNFEMKNQSDKAFRVLPASLHEI